MLAESLKNVSSSQEIVEVLFAAIRKEGFAPGETLPSIRSIATMAGVSPGTAALAFRTLRERGVITTAHGRKTQVSMQPQVHRSLELRVPEGAVNLATVAPDPLLLPDVDRLLREGGVYRPMLYSADNIAETLREVMQRDFHDDGIDGDLTVTSGALDALERLLTARLKPGQTIVVEDPTWASSISLLRTLGLSVIGAPVDDDGMIPEGLEKALASRQCSAVLLTVRAQNPYGSAMSAMRAEHLNTILRRQSTEPFVIENDPAGPISGAPATTATTGIEHWAVIRSVNKTYGPDLRLAVTASDQPTAHLVQSRQLLGPGWVSHFTQRLVSRLMTDKSTQRKVADACEQYRQRREAFLAALEVRGIRAHGRSGLTVSIEVPEESAVVSYLITHGWAVRAGTSFRLSTAPLVRVCISTLAVERAPELADHIAEIIGSNSRIVSP